MLIQLGIGALAAAVSYWLIESTRKKNIKLNWWQWLLTAGCVLYTVFVAEMIVGFLGEGAPQAALVMGTLTGLIAVIWGVLLGRFVFNT